MRCFPLLLCLVACKGPYADVSGSIGGADFAEARSLFFAGPHILLFAEEVDCMDAFFVERAYSDTEPPTDGVFTALQFSVMEDENYAIGTYTFVPNSPVRSYGLTSAGDAFTADRGREGYVSITEVEDGTSIEGEFEVSFTDDTVTGTFRAEYCRNMQP